MTQNEFLEKLRSALGNDLSGTVITENVAYYRQYISEEIEKGRSEEEVMEELGDPWVLARTIIDQVSGEGENYGKEVYTSGTVNEGRQSGSGGSGLLFALGIDTWWKKVLLILGILGMLFLVFAVIGGLFSLFAPILIPLLIIVFIIKIMNSRR